VTDPKPLLHVAPALGAVLPTPAVSPALYGASANQLRAILAGMDQDDANERRYQIEAVTRRR
jgi:hypothetical protein